MKRKLMALLLIVTILAVSVFSGLPTTVAAEENLIQANFSSINAIDSTFNLAFTQGNTTFSVSNAQITDTLNTKALKIGIKSTKSGVTALYYDRKIKIEKNTTYTMSFWTKVTNIKGLSVYMYEPTYIDKNGAQKSNARAQEGQNIYTYTWESDVTRVCRTDVKHNWYVAQTGNVLANKDSMFIARSGGVNQVLTPDYPATERQGEWVQVIHTFKTGDLDSHEADVSYEFRFPSTQGEIWFADIKMFGKKDEASAYFTPTVNDDTLGIASKNVPLYNGKIAEITAEPFGGHIFEGWYVGEELISTDLTYSFTYDPNNKPQYEARFAKGKVFVEDGGYESSTEGVVAQVVKGTANWSNTSFVNSSKDGIHYSDDTYAQDWRKASVTSAYAHTGTKSLLFAGQYGGVGRKISGLAKNADYIVSVYAYFPDGSASKPMKIKKAYVTAGDKSYIKHNGTKLVEKSASDDGVLAFTNSTENMNFTSGWKKISLEFNTGNNTEVVFWLTSDGADAKLYLDNFAIKALPINFRPGVNDAAWGVVTPNEEVEVRVGEPVTVTATPLVKSTFEGWYVEDQLISKDATFTFNFTMDYMNLTAVFKGEPSKITNGNMEEYTNGQVIASFNAKNDPQYTSTHPWSVDTTYRTDDLSLMATNARAHSGSISLVANIPYRYTGLRIKDLAPNTKYIISFYAYATGSDTPTYDMAEKAVNEAFVYPSNKPMIVASESNGKVTYKKGNMNLIMGQINSPVVCFKEWKQVEVAFSTTSVTDVTLWISFAGQAANLYIDDFVIFEPVAASYSAALGGEATANISKNQVAPGTPVTLTAIPYEGNTFASWTDVTGKVVSTDAKFSFFAIEDFSYIATFNGPNKPAREVLSANGIDGTFESYAVNETVPGWYATHKTDGVSWCKYQATDLYAFEGKNSLRVFTRYRNAVFPLTGLVPNSDYRLSFYLFTPDPDASNFVLDNFYIVDSKTAYVDDISSIFASVRKTETNSGWNRIDMYFNSGASTAANFLFYYTSEILGDEGGALYFDNFQLHVYDAESSVVNGDFENGSTKWYGDVAVVADNGSNVLKLEENQTAYNNLDVDEYSVYDISFKAKGKGVSAVLDLGHKTINPKNYISSVAYVDVNGDTWTEYTYKIYTGPQRAINLAFKGGENGVLVDDVKIEKSNQISGAIIEKIDFETERFDLTSATNNSVYSLYSASGNDPYVYSGNRSLKFTYNELLENTSLIFNEAYLSYQPGFSNSIKVTMKLKIVDGKDGGFVGIAPEYSGSYGTDTGFEHMAKTDEWQTVSFYFSNSTYAALKVKINSIAENTKGDFYIDDIVISVTPPMVLEENTKVTYCERLYNAVDNESFENAATAKDWANLPSTVKIVKGEALKGSHFLRASAGTKYVLPVKIQPGKEYYFAASVRGSAGTNGNIGIAIDKNGTEYLLNRDDVVASTVAFDKKESGWKRKGFKFTTDSDTVYLTIDVKSGALDIDSVMMFTSEFGYRYDPNDYTVYLPYDYDNLKSSTTVINGGFGDQPYYKGDDIAEGDSNSPSTGDSIVLPVITIVLAVLASAVLMLIRKRKEGAENA